MKKIGYLIFAWVYRLCSMFTYIHKDKVVLWNGHDHGLNGNLLEMYRAIRQRRPETKFFILAKRDLFRETGTGRRKKVLRLLGDVMLFFVILPYHMATAGKVFLNDNFLPLGYMNTSRKKTQFIQLWHGAGAFKRFGLSTEEDSEVYDTVKRANQKITHLFVTSKQVVPFYEEAFGIKADHIFATGLPVTDLYFDDQKKQKRVQRFYKKYPELLNKKILLYTPTFRRTRKENQQLLKQFDIERIWQILGEEWVICVKFHPKYPMEGVIQNNHCYDMTYYNDVSDLFLVTDLLVTDYSSAIVEYVLLDKPVLLFAYDLARYDRGFYFDYEQMMPGNIAHDTEELLNLLQKDWENMEKKQSFVKFQYDNVCGGACERILNTLK